MTVKYGITVTSDGNGTAAASRTSAEAGTRITLEASAVTGYQFKAWQVIEGDITIRRNSFTMSAEEVSIRAVFEAIKEVVTDGRMAVNEATPDGYKVESDGAWIPQII